MHSLIERTVWLGAWLGVAVATPCVAGGLAEALETYTMPTCRVECARSIQALDGYLLGFNNGEWGGSLQYLDRNGTRYSLVGENVVGFYRLASGVIAITGLAHMGVQYGRVYTVNARASGKPALKPLHDLGGAPSTLRQRPDGEVEIRVYGKVVWTADGKVGRPTPVCQILGNAFELRLVPCSEFEPDQDPPVFYNCTGVDECPPLNR